MKRSWMVMAFGWAVGCSLLAGCISSGGGAAVGDGKLDLSTLGNGQVDIPAISPDAMARLIPLLSVLATASGNPYAAQLTSLIGKTSGDQAIAALAQGLAEGKEPLITVNADGTLNAPATLMQVYGKLSPEAQGQALALFVEYQRGEEIAPKKYLILIYETLAIIKSESPSMGALCEWGIKLYLEKLDEEKPATEFGYSYQADSLTPFRDLPSGQWLVWKADGTCEQEARL